METVTLRGITDKVKWKVGRGKRAILSPEEGTKLLEYLEDNARRWSEIDTLLEPFLESYGPFSGAWDDRALAVKALLSMVESRAEEKNTLWTEKSRLSDILRGYVQREEAAVNVVKWVAGVWSEVTEKKEDSRGSSLARDYQ